MDFKTWFTDHQYAVIGAIAGFLLAVLLIQVGFFQTLLIIICTVAGSLLANYLDRTQLLKKLFK